MDFTPFSGRGSQKNRMHSHLKTKAFCFCGDYGGLYEIETLEMEVEETRPRLNSVSDRGVVPFQSKLIVFWENMCNTCSTFAFSESGEYLGQHTVEE